MIFQLMIKLLPSVSVKTYIKISYAGYRRNLKWDSYELNKKTEVKRSFCSFGEQDIIRIDNYKLC